MSFWQLGQVIESPPQSSSLSLSYPKYVNSPRKVSRIGSLNPLGSILQELLHRRGDMTRLRENHVLELRLIGAERIHGGHALHGGVQFFEQLIGDARCDFRPVAPAQHVFISHDDAVRLSNRGGNG